VTGPVTPVELDFPFLFREPRKNTDNNPLTEEGINLGRHLFYDELLSSTQEKSCASCHKQEHGFADNKAFSDGVNGRKTIRSSMAISNTLWQENFFWDGRATTLEEQALGPIQNPLEMDLDLNVLEERLQESDLYQDLFTKAFPGEEITAENCAKALSQFQRTLISSNSRFDQSKLGLIELTAQELRGEKLFFTHPEPTIPDRGGNCGDCHAGFLTYSNRFSNNGLGLEDVGLQAVTGDPDDLGKFKIVSLRNIELTAPYMHDGRFETLEEVLDHYNEHITQSPTLDILISEATNLPFPSSSDTIQLGLTEQEKEDIIAFMKTLTDESFTTNEAFSSPF